MGIGIRGVGLYGSIGYSGLRSKIGRPATGNSNLMKVKSIDSLRSVSQIQSQKFIENAKRIANSVKGISMISFKI